MVFNLIHSRSAVYKISSNALEFSANEYSRFKFGDKVVAKKFAKELFDLFIKENLHRIKGRNITIYSSPYVYLPTSSFYLTEYFYEKFKNDYSSLVRNIKFEKINRNQTYTVDYGNLAAIERYNLIKNDTYSFNNLPHVNDFLIFIDDISITGSHQFVVESLLSKLEIKNEVVFLYFAKLEDSNVLPSFENELNYAEIKSIRELSQLFTTKEFGLTTRAVKYILALNDSDFDYFIESIKKTGKSKILSLIYFSALENKYGEIDMYRKNLLKMKEGNYSE